MFGTPVSSGLTLTKVLSGLSKTLNVANQVIPLYQQAKPMISNAKSILSVLKEFNKPKKNQVTSINTKEVTKKETIEPRVNSTLPSFFL